MMFSKLTVWPLLLGLLAALPLARTQSDSDNLPDYRYRMELKLNSQQGVVGLRLPKEVYLNARSPNLNDLRLFDANGKKVPFALHTPALQSYLQRSSTPVIVFPVMADKPANADSANLELDIQTSVNGSLLSVRSKGGGNKTGTRLQSLVMDMQPALQGNSKTKPLIESLRFTLPASVSNYSAQVWLEASDDLQHWDTVGTAELSWLVNHEARTLANDKLEFEPRRFRYARLSWHQGEPLEFAGIAAQTSTQIADTPQIDSMEIQAVPGKQGQDLLYRGALAIPVESISLQFAEPNVVFPASIGQYQELPSKKAGQATTWRFEPLTQATFYKITQNGQLRHSGDISLPQTHIAEWVVRPQNAVAGKPVMLISWQAASLIFVTSGQPPYTLAFGRDKVTSGAMDLAQVAPDFSIAELQKLEQATPGPLQQQGGKTASVESEAAITAASAKNRMWILWSVLGLGVLVLGAMAWHLVKQMKQQE